MSTYFYEVAKGHRLPHSPLKAIVAPRPIGWISTTDSEGRVNLAPYSFFNLLSESPPIVGFSSYGWKHSVQNIQSTGEFVANLASHDLAEQMNISSAEVAAGVDEMQLAGLEPAPSTLVKPPRVAAARAALECKLLKIEALLDLTGESSGYYFVLGQVVGVHIDPKCLKAGLFETRAARNLGRCGYRGFYSDTATVFEMLRPGEATPSKSIDGPNEVR